MDMRELEINGSKVVYTDMPKFAVTYFPKHEKSSHQEYKDKSAALLKFYRIARKMTADELVRVNKKIIELEEKQPWL